MTPSPYPADLSLTRDIVVGHGVLIVPLALWGVRIGLSEQGQRRLLTWLMLVWLLLILDFALLGIIGGLVPGLGDLVNAPNLARHGLIIPFSWFGGLALLHIWRTRLSAASRQRALGLATPLFPLAVLAILALAFTFLPLLSWLRPMLNLPEATVTHDDVAAMDWLRLNTAEDALLLAADGEGWLPIFAERRAVDFRAVSSFEWGDISADAELTEVGYVFEPSAGGLLPDRPLRLVFERGDARVYEVVDGS